MRQVLANYLQTITGVSDWNSINFGILPKENSKGWFFLSSSQVINRVRKSQTWVFAIAISATNLNDLSDKILTMSDSILNNFKNPTSCIPGIGSIELSSPIDVESPQSYPNQGNQSETSGFFTAITFSLEIN